jgi:hypothetical protein
MKQLVQAKTRIPFTGTSGFYSSCDILNEDELVTWCQRLGFPTDEAETDELHVTVMYCPSWQPDVAFPSTDVGTATVTGVDLFGPEEDTLVLLLNSPFLSGLHEKWKASGCVPTYSVYRPHLTLQKRVRQCNLELLNSMIQKSPLLTLKLAPEVLEDIKDG